MQEFEKVAPYIYADCYQSQIFKLKYLFFHSHMKRKDSLETRAEPAGAFL